MRVGVVIAAVALAFGCGARTALDLSSDAAAGDPADAGRGRDSGRPRDAGPRPPTPDAGPGAVCEVGPRLELPSFAPNVQYPALARRGDAAMLIFTGSIPGDSQQVFALPITPTGELRGMPQLVHRGFGGTIHRFRSAPSADAFWVIHRDEAGAGLIGAVVSESGIASSAPLGSVSTDTLRPAVAASESIAVRGFRQIGAPVVQFDLFAPPLTGRPSSVIMEGSHVSAALAYGDPSTAFLASNAPEGVRVLHADAFGMILEERIAIDNGASANGVAVLEAPAAPAVTVGNDFGTGYPLVRFGLPEGTVDSPILGAVPGDFGAAWDRWTVAAVATREDDGEHIRFASVAPGATTPAALLDLSGPLGGDHHPAVLATGDPTWTFLVVWERIADASSGVDGVLVHCP